MPSRKKAVEMKCHQCMGEYIDGMVDCCMVTCPLYSWMPYRTHEPNLDWEKYSPRRKGLSTPRVLSDEHKEKIKKNFTTISR